MSHNSRSSWASFVRTKVNIELILHSETYTSARSQITHLCFVVTGVASCFCSGGDLTAAGWVFTAARPADDDVGVFPDDDVGVLLAIAAHVIGFSGFTANNKHTLFIYLKSTGK